MLGKGREGRGGEEEEEETRGVVRQSAHTHKPSPSETPSIIFKKPPVNQWETAFSYEMDYMLPPETVVRLPLRPVSRCRSVSCQSNCCYIS